MGTFNSSSTIQQTFGVPGVEPRVGRRVTSSQRVPLSVGEDKFLSRHERGDRGLRKQRSWETAGDQEERRRKCGGSEKLSTPSSSEMGSASLGSEGNGGAGGQENNLDFLSEDKRGRLRRERSGENSEWRQRPLFVVQLRQPTDKCDNTTRFGSRGAALVDLSSKSCRASSPRVRLTELRE